MDVVYNLTLVKIYNRLDRLDRRYDLVGAEVRIGVHEDYSRNQLCGAPITRQQVTDSNEGNHGIAIRCVREGSAGIYGSVVSVHIPTGPGERRELSLCEVEVYEEGSSISAPPRCNIPERLNGERYHIIGYLGNINEGLPIGGEVEISVGCNPGYYAQRRVDTRCLDGGVWSLSVPICVRMERLCSKPGYIFQVRQYVNGEETKELVTYPNDEIPEGTFLVSRCSQPGQYVLHGSANRTCLDGQWTGQEPSCVLADTRFIFQNNQPLEVRNDGTIIIFPRSQLYIYCRLPFDSNKAAYLESDGGQSGAYWNAYPLTTMIMNLNPPRPSQSGRFTCRSTDSSLSHSVNIQFTEIYCAQPQTPANGGYRNYDFHQPIEGHYMGKSITYTCDNGYVLHGQRRITCILGEWSHPAPTCQRATCEELHAPDNGMIVGGNRIGDSVLIGCNRGYRLHGENFLDCLETGEWSHPMSVCVETPQPVRPCDLVNCEVWQMCETDINAMCGLKYT
nr:E-selectin-like [Lytechinus pictus]